LQWRERGGWMTRLIENKGRGGLAQEGRGGEGRGDLHEVR
jgi:hypothetical protein